MLGMGCHQRACPSVKGFLMTGDGSALFWNMLWLPPLLCLSACCSRIVTLCLGACIFRHVRLRVMTFTGYLWKCHSGHDTALYTVCCTSVCAVTSTEGGGETWPLMTPGTKHGLPCVPVPPCRSRYGWKCWHSQSKVQQVTCSRAQTALTSVGTSGMVSGERPDCWEVWWEHRSNLHF